MVHIRKSKPAMNSLRFGLLVIVVLVATINVIQVDATECGTVNLYREAVFGGEEVIKDEWPFIAALYYSRTSRYFCGGTIISQKHVLTAAHCIQTKGTGVPLLPIEITVRLGAYNLTDRSETDIVDRSVTQIHVHPDWRFNEEKYDADIAVLVLNENVTFSNHIRPVCMPPGDFLIDGLVGTVVGWGKTENGTAEGIPRKIEINALNDAYCYETDKGIARFASERSFCGEGSGSPNEGDSGGGFFAVYGSGWVQFGTVSFIRPKATANVLKTALYMKLTSLKDWIADKVEQSGGNISMSTTRADLNCTFASMDSNQKAIYSCWLFDLNVRQENFVVEEFSGSHDFDKHNDDVVAIIFETGVMASLPRNVGNIFTNLKILVVSVDTGRILRSNFQNLERLEEIWFRNGSVRELNENSLWDLPNLKSFTLDKNELKFLHATTFSKNYKLEIVRVTLNALKSLPWNLFRNNSQLWFVSFSDNSIETIDDRIFEANANLKMVFLNGNRLRHLGENLFRNNPELEAIDLSNNRIKTIDEQIFRANTNLRVLSIALNELEFLPAQLLRGKAFLEDLFLQRNALEAIDEQFFATNLRIKIILLHDNQLTLPTNLFRNNSQLKLLQLASMSIDLIYENFLENISSLQNISFEFNRLVELPRYLFSHNSLLENVIVSWNSLETIDERTFEWNARLREVDFRHNFVTILPGKLFQNNPLLVTVRFGGNSLETIDEQTFQTNVNLRTVDLSSNRLQSLPENIFRNNPLLQIVDFSSNYFTSIFENVFGVKENPTLQRDRKKPLPRNLFQGNSRLASINFSFSSLKVIEINFAVLELANYINLSGNDCIDAAFYDNEGGTYMFSNETRSPKNLTEFQDIVMANCS